MAYVNRYGRRLKVIECIEDVEEVPALIYPSAAEKLLANGIQDKPRISARVRQYEQLLREGTFTMTGDALAIVRGSLLLLNGYHRLTACKNTGIPIPMNIFFAQSKDDYHAYNSGGKVTDAQKLEVLEGVKYSKDVSAVSKLIFRYMQRIMCDSTSEVKARLSWDRFVEISKAVSEVAPKYLSRRNAHHAVLGRSLTLTWTATLFTIADIIDPALAEETYEGLLENSFPVGTTLHAMRGRFEKLEKSNVHQVHVARGSAFIRCLNAHRNGEVLQRIIVPPVGEITSATFPVLWGVQPEDLPF